jgi:hypothetical protein
LKPVVLINSGAYIPQELSAEFGPLPPAFLPVGMRRLYELQAEALRPAGADVFLTLPASMVVPEQDRARLEALGVGVIATPDGLSLGAALLHALAGLGFADRPLRILHGDTLISDLDLGVEDAVAVAEGADGYRWAKVRQCAGRMERVTPPELAEGAGSQLRLTGYFAFASASRFAESLALAGGDFFEALNRYAADQEVTLLRTRSWFDFGHVQTFFRSRRLVTTARAFNTLEITETVVRKRSEDPRKIKAEADWLQAVPPPLRPYTARLIGEGEDERGYFYDTEYAYMPTLAELFVFGQLGLASWRRILASCKAFLDEAARHGVEGGGQGVLDDLAIAKTELRLEEHARRTGFDLDAPNRLNDRPAPSLRRCADDLAALIRRAEPRPAVMHGDYCFSNILFDVRTDRIRLIDPRGLLPNGETGLGGDVRYDLAKLMHSVEGRYDVIIAGRCEAAALAPNEFRLHFPPNPAHDRLGALARGMTMGGVPLDDAAVAATTAGLFLSMLPLHADRPDRQTAFIANALRLHRRLEEGAA